MIIKIRNYLKNIIIPISYSFYNVHSVFRYKKIIFLGSAVLLIIFLGIFIFRNSFTGNKIKEVQKQTAGDLRISLPEAKAKVDINKTFTFPLKDNIGIEISQIEYSIINAELQDNIVSKGKNYTTVKGRTILVLNLKITNKHNKSIEINSRDYVRLSTNGSSELLAADIHNDPVIVQATSTKYTRLGFPIYDTDHNLVVKVGEIGNTKEEVAVNF